MTLFVNGRKSVFNQLAQQIETNDRTIWVHCASLGEYEQGLPLIKTLKKEYPQYKILVTFFSPSGYEVKKNSKEADIITYLPLDTYHNAKRFLTIAKPQLAIFIKYEFWANYLNELDQLQIPTISVSSIFRTDHIFFKPYGYWSRKTIHRINHFFVQNNSSVELLKTIGITNVSLSGDTRFDRVHTILQRDNTLEFIETFKDNQLCMVIGSSWPEDEKLLVQYINQCEYPVKFIFAPHNIKEKGIENLKQSLLKSTVLYSNMNGTNLEEYQVFIADTIGILTKIYSYADIAYVGGGMGTHGLHNTLEPAVFGIPVIIGKEYDEFKEAVDLVDLGGIISIKDYETLRNTLDLIISNEQERKRIGAINRQHVNHNIGATDKVMAWIEENTML